MKKKHKLFSILSKNSFVAENEINKHPIFTYLVKGISDVNMLEDFILISDDMALLRVAEDYGCRNTLFKVKLDQINEIDGKEMPLNYPLLTTKSIKEFTLSDLDFESFKSGKKDIEYFSVNDEVELAMSVGLLSKGFFSLRPIRLKPPYKIEKFLNPGKPKLLFSAPYEFFNSSILDPLKALYEITFAFNAPKSDVLDLIQDKEIWITGTSPPYKIDESIIQKARKLSLIATPSTGTTHMDVNYLKFEQIPVISIKESNVIENIYASSEFSFTLLLAMVNKLNIASKLAELGAWREFEHEFRSIELNGKTLGLIGFGRIGKKMALYGSAFGLNVLYFDPFVDIELNHAKKVNNLDYLLTNSDIVSLHYHCNSENENSFNASHFDMMKSGSYFLNTARGELVDENAMIRYLRNGKLKAAAVDVITNEHEVEKWNHPVIKYARENDNLIISPHIAGCTVDSESKAMADLIRQIIEFQDHE